MRIKFFPLVCALFACTTSSQADQPTIGEIKDSGQKLSQEELIGVLNGNTAVVVLQAGGALIGRGFACKGENSVAFEFIPPSKQADLFVVNCEVIGSSICFDRKAGGHCVAVRRWGNNGDLYAGFDIKEFREGPASALKTVPGEPRELLRPNGELDVGRLSN